MRVLSNIGLRVVATVDHTAVRWLQHLGEGDGARAGEVVALRCLAFAALPSFVIVPLLLVTVMAPSLALPLGVAIVLSFFLALATAVIALPRSRADRMDAPVMDIDRIMFDACPGLALYADASGRIQRAGGRERSRMPSMLIEPVGLTLSDIVHVSDRIAVVQAFDALRLGAQSAIVDARIERPVDPETGRQFMSSRLDMSAVRNDLGDLAAVFVQLRDISEEMKLREEIRLGAEEVRSAHEAKSRFLAAVSHELRTPLNAILGFSDVLAGEYFGKLANDRQREYVGLIRQSGAHLLSVVNTMLDMSKIEAGRYELMTEPFLIGDAVEACRAMLDLQAREKGVTLTTRIQRDLGEVTADRRALQQVLINLVSNAIKFTDANGVVSIDATLAGNDLVLTVSDTGIGIAADKLGQIGQPFVQVQDHYVRSHEGTGLGLSLVKGLVALHGGKFAMASHPGVGTVVTIVLPADGTGVVDAEAAADIAFEFPPRLTSAVENQRLLAHDKINSVKTDQTDIQAQDFADERAEAKIA
ncbi:HAMP domain-containing sensor histidine kinase [Neorhizobium sp. JUb45]|uniref:sensor histidine kinase n=1 Tax=unclassified Neorhizobium TaxID=2629175 RepID=UPI0010446C78|nr:HAMP domain-containing sensor histidine kinase [Neorhizobium sp. JUb45]